MKIRRLSEIDLVRFLSYPVGPDLDQRLRAYDAGVGPWSYDPVRASTADLVNAKTPMFGELPRLSWAQLEEQIRKACKRGEAGEAQAKSNLEVAELLFKFCEENECNAVKHLMPSMPLGFGEFVKYWSDVIIADGNGPFIPFFDQRRQGGVTTPEMRRLVFSMQHNWLRERDIDLSEVRLAVVRFPMVGNERTIRIDFHNDQDLLSYEELNDKVRAVYEAWARISAEKFAQQRKTGTGGGNPFGF